MLPSLLNKPADGQAVVRETAPVVLTAVDPAERVIPELVGSFTPEGRKRDNAAAKARIRARLAREPHRGYPSFDDLLAATDELIDIFFVKD